MEFFDLSILEIIGRLVLGLGIGFCIGLTGVGGGVLVLPALTLLLGLDSVKAVGTTSLFAFLTKVSATFHHVRLKTIDRGTSLRLLAGAIPANIIVALWISGQGANEHFQHSLKFFIAGVVFFSVITMIINIITRSRQSLENEERSLSSRINSHAVLRNGLSILMGGVVGGLIGATSIGGGVLIVPILIILFGLPASRAIGSSIFIAVVLTLVTSMIYGRGGELDKVTAIIMAIGSLTGVYYGSMLSVKVPEKLLQSIVISLIFVATVLMLMSQGH